MTDEVLNDEVSPIIDPIEDIVNPPEEEAPVVEDTPSPEPGLPDLESYAFIADKALNDARNKDIKVADYEQATAIHIAEAVSKATETFTPTQLNTIRGAALNSATKEDAQARAEGELGLPEGTLTDNLQAQTLIKAEQLRKSRRDETIEAARKDQELRINTRDRFTFSDPFKERNLQDRKNFLEVLKNKPEKETFFIPDYQNDYVAAGRALLDSSLNTLKMLPENIEKIGKDAAIPEASRQIYNDRLDLKELSGITTKHLNNYLLTAAQNNASPEEINERIKFWEKSVQEIDTADKLLRDKAGKLKSTLAIGNEFLKQHREAEQASMDAWANLVKDPRLENVFNVAKAEAKELTQEITRGLALPMISYGALTETDPEAWINRVQQLNQEILQADELTQAKIATYQDPVLDKMATKDLAKTQKLIDPLIDQYNEAIKRGDDSSAISLGADISIEYMKGFFDMAMNNKRYATTLAAEEAAQWLPGLGVKLVGTVGGKMVLKTMSKTDYDTLKNTIEKNYEIERKNIINDAKTNVRTSTDKGSGDISRKAKEDLKTNETAKQSLLDDLETRKTKELEQIENWRKNVNKASVVTGVSSNLLESLTQGFNIYSGALDEYMKKTGGKMWSNEDNALAFSFASLATGSDFVFDSFIAKSAGILKSSMKGKRRIIPEAEKDRITKGIANRIIKASRVGSILEKGGKVTVSGAGEGFQELGQTELEINLANYLLGTDLEEDSALQRYLAFSKGTLASGVITGAGQSVGAASDVASAAIAATGKATAIGAQKGLDKARKLEGSGIQFYDAKDEVSLTKSLDNFSTPKNINSAADNPNDFMNQSNTLIRRFLKADNANTRNNIVKVVHAINAVTNEIIKRGEAAETDEEAGRLFDVAAKLRNLQRLHADKINQQDRSEEVIEQFDNNEEIDEEAVKETVAFFGSSPAALDAIKDKQKIEKLQKVAEKTGNTDLAAAIVSRVIDARRLGALRNRIGGAKTKSKSAQETTRILLEGDENFVGLNEYKSAAESLTNTVKKGESTPAIAKAFGTINSGLKALQDNHLRKENIINEAIKSFDPRTGIISQTAKKSLDSIGFKFKPEYGGIKGLETLKRHTSADFERIKNTIKFVNDLQVTSVKPEQLNEADTLPIDDAYYESLLEQFGADSVPEETASARVAPEPERQAQPVSEEARVEQPESEAVSEEEVAASEAAASENTEAESTIDVGSFLDDINFLEELVNMESLGESLLNQLPDERSFPGKENYEKASIFINFLKNQFIAAKDSILGSNFFNVLENMADLSQVETTTPQEKLLVNTFEEMYSRVSTALDLKDDAMLNQIAELFQNPAFAKKDKRHFAGEKANYLTSLIKDDFTFPEEIKVSIALAMTNFVVGNQNLNNLTDEALVNSFGLDYENSGHRLPKKLREKYKYKGRKDDFVASTIGKDAFAYLGLQPVDQKAYENFKQNFEVDMGMLALHVMNVDSKSDNAIFKTDPISGVEYQKDFVEIKNFNKNRDSDETVFKESEGDPADKVFYKYDLPAQLKDVKKKAPIFERIFGYIPLEPRFAKVQPKFAEAELDRKPLGLSNTFNTFFLSEKEWNMPKFSLKAVSNVKYGTRKHNITAVHSQEKADDLNKYNQTPYGTEVNILSFFLDNYFNADDSQKARFLRLLGYVPLSELEDSTAAKRENQEGKNVQILSDLEKLKAFLDYVDKKGIDLATTDIYLPQELQSNDRIQNQRSAISPLGSKIHRSLFPVSVKEKNGKVTTTKQIPVKGDFDRMVAIGQKMKLIGDTDSPQQVQDAFIAFTPVLNKAVNAYESLQEGFSEQAWKDLEEFVNKADYPTAAFEVINDEIQRRNAEGGTYTSTLNVSMDGIASGMFISIYQLSGQNPNVSSVTKMMGAFAENNQEQSLTELDKNEPDPYETVAIAFLNAAKAMALKGDQVANALVNMLTISENFVWKNDEISTEKDNRRRVRSVMKHDVLAKTFGRGAAGVQNGIIDWIMNSAHDLAETAIDDYHKEIRDANGNITTDENILEAATTKRNNRFRRISNILNTFIQTKKPIDFITPENYRSFNLKTSIFPELASNSNRLNELSQIFDKSTEQVLFDYEKNRNLINAGYRIQYALYEKFRNAAIRNATKRHAKEDPNFNPATMQLPIEIRKAIDKRLYKILPKIRTLQSSTNIEDNDDLPLSNLTSKTTKERGTTMKRGTINFGRESVLPSFKAVGATIKIVHALEASVALKAATLTRVLSTHDAHNTSLADAKKHNELLNKTMFEALQAYNLMEEVGKSLETSLAFTAELVNGNLINALTPQELKSLADEIQKSLVASVTGTENRKIAKEKVKKFREGKSDKAFIQQSHQFYNPLINTIKNKKTKLGVNLTNLQHYAYPGSGFKFPNEVQKVIKESAPAEVAPIEEPTSDLQIERNKFISKLLNSKSKYLGNIIEQMEQGFSGREALSNLAGTRSFDDMEKALKRLGYTLDNVRNIAPVGKENDDDQGDVHIAGSSPASVHGNQNIFGQTGTTTSKLTADNIVDKLSMLANAGSRAESPENMRHLLNWFGGLFNPYIKNIQLHYNANGKFPSAGLAKIKQTSADIYMNAASNLNESITNLAAEFGIPMSGAEILAHETTHVIVKNLMDQNHPLIREVAKIWESVKANPSILSAEDLIPDGVLHTQEMIDRAQFTYNYIFNDPKTSRRHKLNEFIAFMVTNEGMRNKLSVVTPQDVTGSFKHRSKTRIGNFLNKLYAFLMKTLGNYRFDATSQNYTKQFDGLMQDLFAVESLATNKISKVTNGIEYGVNGAVDKIRDTGIAVLNNVRKSPLVVNATGKYGRGVNNFFDIVQLEQDVKAATLRPFVRTLENFVVSLDMFGIEEIFAEVLGNTERNRFASDLIRIRNNDESKERQETMDGILKVLSTPFLDDLPEGETKIPEATKKALLDFVIRNDLASLVNADISTSIDKETGESIIKYKTRNRDEFNDYIRSLAGGGLLNEMKRVRAEISNLVGNPTIANAFHNSAKSLGNFLVHQQHSEAIGLSSVVAIIDSIHTEYKVNPNYDLDVLKFHLNTLGTLEALYESSDETIQNGLRVMESQASKDADVDGFFRMVQMHKELQEKARTSELFTDELNFVKGYFKEVVSDPDVSFKVSKHPDDPELKKLLYKRVAQLDKDPLVSSVDKTPRYLYVSKYDSTTEAMVQGAISTANREGGRGTSIVFEGSQGEVFYDPGTTLENLDKARSIEIKRMGNRVVDDNKNNKRKFSSSALVKRDAKNNLVLVDIKSQMSWENKLRFLETKEDPFESLASTGGNIVSKIRGRKVNEKVIDGLLKDYNDNRASLPTNAYIWIGAGQKKGTKNEQRWALLPKATRDYIHSRTGEHGIYVRRDVANSIFGYRKISVRNIVDYVHNDPETNNLINELFKKAIRYQLENNPEISKAVLDKLVMTENLLVDLVEITKDAVVVKSIFVNLVNMLSNTAQLVVNGLSITDALRLQIEGIDNGVRYSIAHARRKEIRTELVTLKENTAYKKQLQDELEKVNDELARNPVAFLMEAGAMQTIVEDIETYTLGDPNLNRRPLSKFGNKVLEASPEFIRMGVSQLTMHSSTSTYKWANNAVKLSDFSARYALAKHLEVYQPEMSKEAIIHKVMDEFIDYDIPTNRWIQYLNDVGLLWFTKYGLRSAGIAARLAVNHPEGVAKLVLFEHLFGDISTVMDFNASGRFGEPFGRFLSAIDDIATINISEAVLF